MVPKICALFGRASLQLADVGRAQLTAMAVDGRVDPVSFNPRPKYLAGR